MSKGRREEVSPEDGWNERSKREKRDLKDIWIEEKRLQENKKQTGRGVWERMRRRCSGLGSADSR